MDDDAPPGVPEWVVTYGDMMSLLLTFFIMLVSLSEVVADKKYRAILDSLMRYTGYRTAPVAPPGKSFPLNSLIEKMDTLGAYSDNPAHGGVKTLAPAGEDIRVRRLPEGDAVAVEQPVLFIPATADLAAGERERLDRIAAEVAGKPNKIEVRGRVSATQLPLPTNEQMLQLSYQRAKLVSEELSRNGIDPDRIRITAEGPATTAPTGTEYDAANDDSVSVYLLNEFAATYVGPRDEQP